MRLDIDRHGDICRSWADGCSVASLSWSSFQESFLDSVIRSRRSSHSSKSFRLQSQQAPRVLRSLSVSNTRQP